MDAGVFGEPSIGRPVKKSALPGMAVLLAFVAAFCAVYALAYPIGGIVRGTVLSIAFGSAWAMCNLILALAGLALIARHARDYRGSDVAVALSFGALIWLSTQSRYWLTGTTPAVPFLSPTFDGLEAFLMTLGAIGLLKAHPVLRLRLAGKDFFTAAGSLLLGALLGLPFAIFNVWMALQSGLPAREHGDLVAGALLAIQPGLMEEITFRLLFLGLAIVVLSRFLPGKIAVSCALAMAVVFHAALHVQGMLISNPVSAIVSVLLLSVMFGLPMALLAYKRDLESAAGFHWVLDAIRFSIFRM